MRYLHRLLSRQYAPRWLILSLDLSICVFAILFAWILSFSYVVPVEMQEKILYSVLLVSVVRLISFKIGRSYSGIIRYTSTEDAKRIFLTVFGGTLAIAILNILWTGYSGNVLIPSYVIIMDFALALLLMTSYRIGVKIVFPLLQKTKQGGAIRNVAIYGAGRSGLITKRSLDQDGDSKRKIVAFFDDDPHKTDKYLEDVPILYSDTDLEPALAKGIIDELIISIQQISAVEKDKIVERCIKYKVKVRVVPPVNKWINGELDSRQIKNIKIEDLMDRAPIQLGLEKIRNHVRDKTLLVTGASGSIGRELVHQLASFGPGKIIIVDFAESPLHELQLEMEDKHYNCYWKAIVADVRQYDTMRKIMEKYKPELVYHAAAYKHVPLMESHPSQAVMTNVLGTKVMAELSHEFEVEKFVLVSTDKAVNPTNVMGASKRVAEIFVQSLNNINGGNVNGNGKTRFITTRFGNVLGSNGSVIPRFQKQIERYGPVTVTHPDISRYFMTIPEACQLIIEAGVMGNGGEIYVFDMGESVRILDLAKKMIKLAGFEPDKDIPIVFSGLRPGEKIREELLSKDEDTIPTYHPKILIAKVRTYSFEKIESEINWLVETANNKDNNEIVKQLKEIVPEYISKNSSYEMLDSRDEYSEERLAESSSSGSNGSNGSKH